MKIYLSGNIEQANFEEAKVKFKEAQEFLWNLNFSVVNPLRSGLYEDDFFEQRVMKRIKLLLPCNAIYLFDGWKESVEAGIEHDIAVRTNKLIYYETDILTNDEYNVFVIKNAIYQATGSKFNEYTTKRQDRYGTNLRMIFAYNCSLKSIHPNIIAKSINRDRSLVFYYLKKYNDLIKFDPEFRLLARKVDNILKQTGDE